MGVGIVILDLGNTGYSLVLMDLSEIHFFSGFLSSQMVFSFRQHFMEVVGTAPCFEEYISNHPITNSFCFFTCFRPIIEKEWPYRDLGVMPKHLRHSLRVSLRTPKAASYSMAWWRQRTSHHSKVSVTGKWHHLIEKKLFCIENNSDVS